MAAGKRRTFDTSPGTVAARVSPQPVPVPEKASRQRKFAKIIEPDPIPEPYPLGTRVSARGYYGRIFNATKCVCPNGSGYCYVVELDEIRHGSWFRFEHSPGVKVV